MRHLFIHCKTLFIGTLLCFSAVLSAEQFQQFNKLEVHYIALPSTFIQPDIAKQYSIKRSSYNGLINISILDNTQDKKAVSAQLTGTGNNLIGQTQQLQFTEIKEGDAIYYLAEYPYTNEEIVNFEINIKTDAASNTLKFQHKFYAD
jgi:hypothetical protein